MQFQSQRELGGESAVTLTMPAKHSATPKHRRDAAYKAEDTVCEYIQRRYADKQVCRSENQYATLDGFLLNTANNSVHSVFEVKARNLSFTSLGERFGYKVMVDRSKLLAMQEASNMWRVPSYLYYYFMPDGLIYEIPITNEKSTKICISATKMKTVPKELQGDMSHRDMTEILMDGGTIITSSAPKMTI